MTTFRVARRRHYKPIDVRTLNDERLSFRARGVLVFLLSKPDDWTFTAESISACGTEGRDAVRAVLNELSLCGYLVQTRKREGGRFITDSVLYEHPDDAPPERKTSAGVPETDNQHRETRPSTEASLRDAETEDGNRNLASLAVIGDDDGFTGFWTDYPRKVGKPDARKAWRKALKSGASPARITLGLADWRVLWASPGFDPDHVPYPATWLRREQWNDHVQAPKTLHRSNLAKFDEAAAAFLDGLPGVALELGR